jgi:hypothetical protein
MKDNIAGVELWEPTRHFQHPPSNLANSRQPPLVTIPCRQVPVAPHGVCSRSRINGSAETVECGFESLHAAMSFVQVDLHLLSVADGVSEAQSETSLQVK